MRISSGIKILTDGDHGEENKFGNCRKILLPNHGILKSRIFSRHPYSIIRNISYGIKCWLGSLFYNRNIPIITVGHGHGFFYAFIQYIFKPILKPRTHVIFEFLLERKPKGILRYYHRLKVHIFKKAVTAAIIYGRADIHTFSKEYDLPTDKLIFYPFHETLRKYNYKIYDGGFIFAGGNGGRDYVTLIEAVKNLTIPVVMATSIPGIADRASYYKHITVEFVSHEKFRQLLASCSIFVECHAPEFFRTAGHQTMVNAMWMGKPVILADKKSADGYIIDGVDGVAVEAGDVKALRDKIEYLLTNPDIAHNLAAEAQKKVKKWEFTSTYFTQSIYNIAIKLNCKRYGIDISDRLITLY